PGIFVIIEDVVAVEGGGEREFRRALREQYDASPIFQSLLWQMNWVWGGGPLATAVVRTLLIYSVRWILPWVWAVIGTAVTVPWVKRVLAEERRELREK
ncbi:hypothetical protein V2W45_1179563, partial [Cenococcum geophilum]